mmetsp:Transcript_31059/g.97671  ORF Transcript_31059/g.97671 Transcript_31059/m.97671 type:complete len:236 (+) Transcript_31059:2-709(+)
MRAPDEIGLGEEVGGGEASLLGGGVEEREQGRGEGRVYPGVNLGAEAADEDAEDEDRHPVRRRELERERLFGGRGGRLRSVQLGGCRREKLPAGQRGGGRGSGGGLGRCRLRRVVRRRHQPRSPRLDDSLPHLRRHPLQRALEQRARRSLHLFGRIAVVAREEGERGRRQLRHRLRYRHREVRHHGRARVSHLVVPGAHHQSVCERDRAERPERGHVRRALPPPVPPLSSGGEKG